ncbi:MAG: RidA family protein [Methanomassiliicoccales archaeon]|nr:MAG: RidA family protein [Methanomassiliicoccales archaeon]
MEKRIFNSEKVAATGAPYSQAVIKGDLIFVSGQVAMDPVLKEMISGSMEQEVEQIMGNLRSLLEEMGSSLEKVLKVTVFLTDMGEFQRFNEAYKKYFPKEPPARSCVEVAHLPFGARIELDAIAYI